MAFDLLSRTQSGVAGELESIMRGGMLPQSILLAGRHGSSRLTAALDLAFTLTGEESVRKYLRSGQVIYIPSREMMSTFRAALRLFRRQRNDSSRLFLIETVRRALLQYHSSVAALYDGKRIPVKGTASTEEGKGGSSYFANAEAVDSLILDLEDAAEFTDGFAERTVSELERRMVPEFFTIGKKTPGATIDEIRVIQDWLEEGTLEKVVIFENPEDYTEGARNSMLKMLEEPPEHSHLILLSEHPARILPTILSRVRRFQIPELSGKKVSEFIGERFGIYGSYPSFDAFFFEEGTEEEDRKTMERCVDLYFSALTAGRMLPLAEENTLFADLERLSGYAYFRERVSEKIEDAVRNGMKAGKAVRVWNAFSSMLYASDIYNMSIRTALDLALREACHG